MTQIPDKPSIEEAMEHFGKKGMHWGVRKGADSGSGGGSPKKVKPTTADIQGARFRTQARVKRINSASEDHAVATSSKGRSAAMKIINDNIKADLKSGDSKLAAKSTKGEKIAAGIAYGLSGAIVVSMIAGR